MALMILYGGMAVLALWATWHEPDLRWIGLALAFSFTASNLVWFFGTLDNRTGVFTMCEIFVALAAYMAWEDLRYRALAGLGIICAISITANIAFVSNMHPKWSQIHTYELITNLCFALECLTTAGMGIAHGVGIGRFRIWPGHRDEMGQSHGVRNREP
jgi:hypothetical protein